MAPPDSTDSLLQTWAAFCDQLKGVGQGLLQAADAAPPLDRAEGLRYLSRLVCLGLDLLVENNDPAWPWMQLGLSPTRKMGGDNPDGLYHGAPLDGKLTYRVFGQRGTADYLGLTVLGGLVGMTGQRRVIANLSGKDLHAKSDGSFEVIVSPDPQPGNYLKLEADASRLVVRQFFLDWEKESPALLHIERVGPVALPPFLAPERLAPTLGGVGTFLAGLTALWRAEIAKLATQPNQLHRLPNAALVQGSPDVFYDPGYFRLADTEALIVEFHPPRAHYWNIQIGNRWYESIDYRYHLASLNSGQAAVDADGRVRVVIAHRDPGVWNWLDTAGHREGHLFTRWLLAVDPPVPDCKVVKFDELHLALPVGTRRCTSAQRMDELRKRRLAVERRFA
jgi:hypothetical protein